MKAFTIPKGIIKELIYVGFAKDISNPEQLLEIGWISDKSMKVIASKSQKVFISKRALKRIIDRRGNEEIIYLIPDILNNPTKITDNTHKRACSFIFTKMNGRYHGVVVEVTKTPDCENQVVSAFIIDPKTYRKMSDISGGTAP